MIALDCSAVELSGLGFSSDLSVKRVKFRNSSRRQALEEEGEIMSASRETNAFHLPSEYLSYPNRHFLAYAVIIPVPSRIRRTCYEL